MLLHVFTGGMHVISRLSSSLYSFVELEAAYT